MYLLLRVDDGVKVVALISQGALRDCTPSVPATTPAFPVPLNGGLGLPTGLHSKGFVVPTEPAP